MLFSLAAFITLLTLVYVTITDIQEREVPDWVPYTLFAVAAILRVVFSVIEQDWNIILEGIYGLVFFAVGYALYRLGQWGGGDAKLLGGMGVLFGTSFIPGFMLAFLINLFILGGIWGLLFASAVALKHWKTVKKKRFMYEGTVFLVSILLIAVLFFLGTTISLSIALFILLFFLGYALIPRLQAVDEVMHRTIPPEKLVEGDWLVHPVKKGKKIIATRTAIGLTNKEIHAIQASGVKQITVKDGIPFVPSFLIGFIVTLMVGNLVFIVAKAF